VCSDPTTGQPLRSTPCKKHPLITKTIINKISGSAGPGELIAVLGARCVDCVGRWRPRPFARHMS
jgi:hypothetical protein